MPNKKLTQAKLKKLLHYNPETGVFTRRVRTAQRIQVGDIAGSKHNCGYLSICIDSKPYLSHRLVWLYVYGYLPENQIDHINRNQSDNMILNLREVSRQCNMRNTGNRKNNTSKVKGVSWHKHGKKWSVNIRANNKSCYGGLYKDFDEAVCTRLALEQSLNWEGCDSSSPAFKYNQARINAGK